MNSDILFFDGKNDQIVQAINFEQSGSNSQTSIDPTSPVVPNLDKYFYEGVYKFSVVGSSLKPLSLTVTKEGVSFQGCNIWNMKYIAATNGTVKFYPGVSTKRACLTSDNDRFYADALLSSVKFNEMKGMITFYDSKGKSVAQFNYDAVASGTAPSSASPILPQSLPTQTTPPKQTKPSRPPKS